MSQKTEILQWLKKRRHISAIEALEHIGCFRLAARIEELRHEGWEIQTEVEPHSNGWHARYFLKRKKPHPKMRLDPSPGMD